MKEKPLVVYIYDSLCGWCYGFSPVMKNLAQDYAEKIDFVTLSGGMIVGDRVGPIVEVAPYIKKAYKDVEDRTGVQFGEQFLEGVLEDGQTIFTSLPSSVALNAFKKQLPSQSVLYAHELQRAVYFEGKNPSDLEHFGKLAEELGANRNQFLETVNSKETRLDTLEEFKLVQTWGVTGFPTLLGFQGEKGQFLAHGYTDYKTLQERIQVFLKN